MRNEPARIAIEYAGPGQIKELEDAIRAYGRQERARGLRAAARQARRKGRLGSGYFSECTAKSGDMCPACETRKELASWCDLRARAIEKGRK